MFASLESHFATWAKTVADDVSAHARDFLEHAKIEESSLATEVAHLKAAGLKVIDAAGNEL